MNDNRGPEPKLLTKMKLCAITAGRCQYCNKFLFTEPFSLEDNNNSNLAHIVASSPNGPRGDSELSYKLSDNIDNLMLMCLEHHHFIDNNPEVFTVEVLKKMKQESEKRIAEYDKVFDIEESEIVIFRSSIKGKSKVDYSLPKMAQALFRKKRPKNLNGIDIFIECKYNYKSKEYWKEVEHDLEYEIYNKIYRELEKNPESHFSIFPIAPMPLIIKFGYIFGDKIQHTIYQYFRGKESWEWQKEELTNSFEITKRKISKERGVALLLSLTGSIELDRIKEFSNIGTVYEIRAENQGVDCISSEEDLNNFWHVYQRVCEKIKDENFGLDEVFLFPSMPVSAAFSVGSRYMRGVYPKFKIYDDDNGFFETLSIGGE